MTQFSQTSSKEQNQGLKPDCLTSQYGFIAAMAARSILSGAALPTHDAVVLGAERLLGQRLVTLGATETLLMPVATLMAELLMEEGTGESLMRGSRRVKGQ